MRVREERSQEDKAFWALSLSLHLFGSLRAPPVRVLTTCRRLGSSFLTLTTCKGFQDDLHSRHSHSCLNRSEAQVKLGRIAGSMARCCVRRQVRLPVLLPGSWQGTGPSLPARGDLFSLVCIYFERAALMLDRL